MGRQPIRGFPFRPKPWLGHANIVTPVTNPARKHQMRAVSASPGFPGDAAYAGAAGSLLHGVPVHSALSPAGIFAIRE